MAKLHPKQIRIFLNPWSSNSIFPVSRNSEFGCFSCFLPTLILVKFGVFSAFVEPDRSSILELVAKKYPRTPKKQLAQYNFLM